MNAAPLRKIAEAGIIMPSVSWKVVSVHELTCIAGLSPSSRILTKLHTTKRKKQSKRAIQCDLLAAWPHSSYTLRRRWLVAIFRVHDFLPATTAALPAGCRTDSLAGATTLPRNALRHILLAARRIDMDEEPDCKSNIDLRVRTPRARAPHISMTTSTVAKCYRARCFSCWTYFDH